MNRRETQLLCENLFLPDFCGIRMVFFIVIIAQLFAFVLVLAPLDVSINERWSRLGLISLFVQWAALSSSAVLCVCRPYLCRLSNVSVASISYVIIILVIALVSEAAYWLVQRPILMAQGISHTGFILRNVLIGAILTGPVLRYFYVQHQWRRKIKAESEARLQALQSRIRPHFLFNSMNTIASLTRTQPEQAEAAVEDLADLFRVSLRDARQWHRLADEFALCRRYVHIEQLRLGERLQVQWEVEDLPEDAMVPPLLIQPLLENAIYHGIEPLTSGGLIRIAGHMTNGLQGGQITLSLHNPAPVLDKDKHLSGNRLALENIRERLLVFYDGKGRIETRQEDGDFVVHLQFPYRKEAYADPDRR